MLAATPIGVFLIPMLYVVVQRLREWFHGTSNAKTCVEGETGPA